MIRGHGRRIGDQRAHRSCPILDSQSFQTKIVKIMSRVNSRNFPLDIKYPKMDPKYDLHDFTKII